MNLFTKVIWWLGMLALLPIGAFMMAAFGIGTQEGNIIGVFGVLLLGVSVLAIGNYVVTGEYMNFDGGNVW